MQMVHGLFNRIETFGAPTIVGIDGIAVGGGLEIALTFDRLLTTASNKTKLGFPEVIWGFCRAMVAVAAPMGGWVPRS